MSMSVGGDKDEVMSTINTTPLVDVMLVMLIIFLITIPVIVPTVKLELPEPRNIPGQTKPENIPINVDAEGNFYFGNQQLADRAALFAILSEKTRAAVAEGKLPPEVHLKADRRARYEQVARVLYTIQTAGIAEVSFLSEPKGTPE